MSITTTHFVSVGFTLKVWRNWIRTKGMRLRKALRVHLRLPLNRMYWVFGSPRGGTTWLMEVLQRGFGLHSIHEPTMRHNPDFPKSDIDAKVRIATHLNETDVPGQWLSELVAGRYSNYSIDKSNPVLSLRPRRGVVLKDINPKTKVVLYEKMTQPAPNAKAYLEAIFGKFDRDPKLGKRSQTDMRKPPGTTPNIESETAEMISIFGLAPFTLPGQPHLIDLEALVADYRKPASDRLTPRFMR